jgi:beta-glucosidase
MNILLRARNEDHRCDGRRGVRWSGIGIITILSSLLVLAGARAQEVSTLPFMDASLSPEQRAADLVHRMTLQEKASQLVNQARAIPRLGVPAYDWWSEALHGVLGRGVTEFPQPIGLAATFDARRSTKWRRRLASRAVSSTPRPCATGHSSIFEGLDFWAPNVNIFRDPRWGRGQETYGEDPVPECQTGGRVCHRDARQNDPVYYRAISTPKHFAVHSGPEPTRHFADIDISRHDEEDTYLPAFRAAVVEGHAASVMCAYNSINGEPACASQFLLQHILRGAWHFQGYVVSDCGAVRDIFDGHHFRATQPQSSAIALERGMDNECIDSLEKVQDDHDFRPYIEAVQQGYLSEQAVDAALIRLFTARVRLGMFDPPSKVSYANIDESELDSAAHRRLAGRLADESMVLLKNDGVLPLKAPKHIAIIGPLAEQTAVLLGNYNGLPTHTVSVLDAMKAEFPGAQITYVPGTQFLSNQGDSVPRSVLTTAEGKPGLLAEYGSGFSIDSEHAPFTARVEDGVDLSESNIPDQAHGKPAVAVRWSGVLNPRETGDYLLGVRADGFARITLGGEPVMQMYGPGTTYGPSASRAGASAGVAGAVRSYAGQQGRSAAHLDPCDRRAGSRRGCRSEEGRRGHCRGRHYQPP